MQVIFQSQNPLFGFYALVRFSSNPLAFWYYLALLLYQSVLEERTLAKEDVIELGGARCSKLCPTRCSRWNSSKPHHPRPHFRQDAHTIKILPGDRVTVELSV